MKQITFPAEFKFFADSDLHKTAQFILLLLQHGFEAPMDKDEFITQYALSKDSLGYCIEDNTIKVFLSGLQEECFAGTESPLVEIKDYDLSAELPENLRCLSNNKDIIDKTIRALNQAKPSELSSELLSQIEMLGFALAAK